MDKVYKRLQSQGQGQVKNGNNTNFWLIQSNKADFFSFTMRLAFTKQTEQLCETHFSSQKCSLY